MTLAQGTASRCQLSLRILHILLANVGTLLLSWPLLGRSRSMHVLLSLENLLGPLNVSFV
jgi:hypothetical protein